MMNRKSLSFFFFLFFISVRCPFAQQFQLSDKAKNKIEQNIVNSSTWDRLQELKMLQDNFGYSLGNNSPYAKQINDIYEQYSYTLVEREFQQEIEWINIQRENQKVLQMLNNTQRPVQSEIATIQKEMQQGKAPQQNSQQQIQKEVADILQEIKQDEAKSAQTDYYHSPEYLDDLSNYIKVKELLKSMLDGKIPLSLRDAYYFEEAAYGNLHLSYNEYVKLIADNALFIKQWLKENKYDVNDAEILHFGIQKFMSDTIFITVNGKKSGHTPYYYDYVDAFAKEDKRNYFVTKTLATGGGQCNTLPIIYMLLAEQLGVDVNLGFNPHHTFIRYLNKKGVVVNYEATIGRVMPSQWYLEVLPIMAKSNQNGIFLNSLGRQKIIATRLFDLANNFLEEHGLGNQSFIKECMDIATPYFPNEDYICIANYNIKKSLYAYQFNKLVKQYHIQNLSEIENYADVSAAYHTFYDYVEKINSLGVQDFPESEYLELLSYYDTKGKLQTAKKIDSKSKKSLFFK